MTKLQIHKRKARTIRNPKKFVGLVKNDSRAIANLRKEMKSLKLSKNKAPQLNHDHVHHFLQRAVNPIDRTAPRVGVPRFPSTNSFKSRGFVDFDMIVGSGGYGFVCLNPSMANDVQSFAYTGQTFAGNQLPANITVTALTPGVVTGTLANLPYPSSLFSNGLSVLGGRIVAAGFELEYTGTLLAEGGTIYSYNEPEHGVMNNYTVANFTQRTGCVTQPVRRNNTSHFSLHHALYVDGDYSDLSYPWDLEFNNGGTTTPNVLGGIIVSSTAGNLFHCRLTIDVEFTGTTAEPAATINPIAPPGAYETAIEVCQKVRETHAQNPTAKPHQLAQVASNIYAEASGIARKVRNSKKTVKGIFKAFKSSTTIMEAAALI
jgi:hypothetical protein